jgi:phosphatidylserine/phosphatidylglycerophosphate/cardiolipin synthase-like enzyme/uncharacterized membrane protein YdjX (TVP38/TMEM64 family)
MSLHRLLKPGHNCWRIERAERVSFLIDGENYFRILHGGLTRARHCIQILAWDIDSRIELIRNTTGDVGAGDWPSRIGELLESIAERRPDIRIYILNWDYSLLFAPEREFLPNYKFEWRTQRRLRFCMDNKHPLGASHHQKVVVIDDALAFAGGLDIARGRWDTQAHRPADPRRDSGDNRLLRPYHDVQMMVAGKAAAALGDLARRRFARATRHHPPRSDTAADLWPSDLAPDLTDVPVAILRTEPSYLHYPAVREVETFYLESIAAARRLIYIENQFFTAGRIAAALARRLEEPAGPEVILLFPQETDGWLSQSTMDILRQHLLQQLRQSDRHGRLGVYYPYRQDQGDQPINLHAKVTIIDDELVRVGSANLNNRSMGLDTECDLAIEAAGEARIRTAIAAFRDRLLGEHLDVPAPRIAQAAAEQGSLLAAIDALRGNARTLRPLEPAAAPAPDAVLSGKELIDPEGPIVADEVVRRFVRDEERPVARRRIGWWAALLLAALALALAWRWTSLSEWLNIGTLTAAMLKLKALPAAPVILLATYLVGSLVALPITLLIIVTILAFGPWQGLLYAFTGTVLGALSSYYLGYLLNPDLMRRLAGTKVNELSRRLSHYGLLTIIVMRIIPVAPFTVVNMVAGATHIRLRDFIGGTVIGMAPGIIVIALFIDRIVTSIESPDAINLSTLAVVIGLIAAATFILYRWLRKRTEGKWKNPAARAAKASPCRIRPTEN